MLTELQVKSAKPKEKRYRITDRDGLSLIVHPSGKKVWTMRYKEPWGLKKQRTVTLGQYPLISLKRARLKAYEIRLQIAEGDNPRQEEVKEGLTFQALAEEWLERRKHELTLGYHKDIKQRIEKNLYPYLADMPLKHITTPVLLSALKNIEKRGVFETAKRMKQVSGQIFKYGIAHGYCSENPARDLDGILISKPVKHYATTTDPEKIKEILELVFNYYGTYSVALALKLAPFVFLRPSELAGLRKEEVFLEGAMLKISPDRMKKRRAHWVPLSEQALMIVKEAYETSGQSEYLFPSNTTWKRPITADSLRMGMRRAGISKKEFTTHGFRHMASTLLNEMGFDSDAIELQLAHVDKNTVRGTYNHAQKLEYRKEMMQKWADFLTGLAKVEIKEPVKVYPSL